MAVVFETDLRTFLLDQLDDYGASTVGYCVDAFDTFGGTGTRLGQAAITMGAASNGVKSSTNTPMITIPSGTVKSIALARYKTPLASGDRFQIGWKNTPDYVFATIGTITITSVTLSITN